MRGLLIVIVVVLAIATGWFGYRLYQLNDFLSSIEESLDRAEKIRREFENRPGVPGPYSCEENISKYSSFFPADPMGQLAYAIRYPKLKELRERCERWPMEANF